MKKSLLAVVIIIALTALFSLPALAEDTWFSIGYKDDAASLAVGIRPDGQSFGYEIGLIYSSEYSDANDYPCPHYDYHIVSDDDIEYSCGLDVLWFPGAAKNFYLGAGLYLSNERTISQSNVTGWEYVEDEDAKIDIPLSIGLIFPTKNGSFGIGYHQLRGANIKFSIGF